MRVNPQNGERVSTMDKTGIWESFIPGTEPDPDNPAPRLVLGQGNFSMPGREVEKPVADWGGAISGEHGIGLAKKRWWSRAVSKEVRELHRTIKKALDPKGILNPGKFV